MRADGRTVGATMLGHLAAENAGAEPLGSFGAVVGATLGDLSAFDLAINGPLLAPGIGAQGATPADLPRVFGAAVRNVVPNVSRGVLRHGPDVGGAACRGGAVRRRGRAALERRRRRPSAGTSVGRLADGLEPESSSNPGHYVLNVLVCRG